MPVLKYSRSEGVLTKIQPRGFALEITNQAEYKEMEIPLNRGDFVVLYSDGLVETRDKECQIRDEEHFYATMGSVVAKEGTCKSIAGSVLEKVLKDDYSDYPEDGQTIVVIHKEG